MKGIPALLMRTLVVLIGVGALAFLILEPLSEGRNTHATLSEVYLHDPFLALLYAASILFFLALYRVFRLTGRTADAEARASDLRVIRNCALSLVAVLAWAETYLLSFVRGTDDIAGGVTMGLFMITAFAAVAVIAERRLRA